MNHEVMKHTWEVVIYNQDDSLVGFTFSGTSGQLANLVNNFINDERIKDFKTTPLNR